MRKKRAALDDKNLKGSRLSPWEFGQSPAPFSGLVRPAVYSPGVLAWDGKGLLKLIYVYYGIRENDLRKNDIH